MTNIFFVCLTIVLLLSCTTGKIISNESTYPNDFLEKEISFDENLCLFNPDMIQVKDGLLRVGIRDVLPSEKNITDLEFFGGELTTDISPRVTDKEPQMFGRFVVRMKANSPSGVVTSFFLTNYRWNGNYTKLEEGCEIDIEFCGRTDQVELAIHYVDPKGILKHTDAPVVKLPVDAGDGFHLWEIEVMPDYIKYYYDGEVIYKFTDPVVMAEMKHPLSTSINYWIANSEAWVGKIDRTKLPLTTVYDYVAFYAWEGQYQGDINDN